MSASRFLNFSNVLHVMIWTLLLGVPTVVLPGGSFYGLSKRFFIISSIYHIGVFYFNAYFLYPKLLTKKRWWLYIPAIAAVIALSYQLKLYFLRLNPEFVLSHENSRVILFGIMPFIIGSILFRLISDRIKFERLEKEARAQRLEAELKFLRSQVSPHFLFNMLANMVSLARHKSELLEPSLIKLSELLRYMLYDSSKGKITVGKEIDHLENYVGLQKLRFGGDVSVKMKIENYCSDYLVEPMLLVPFIENAFKHGVGMLNDPFIEIYLKVGESTLHFEVKNNHNSEDRSKDKDSGIGLVNVKNRLELLYPKKHNLFIENRDGIFHIELNLYLS